MFFTRSTSNNLDLLRAIAVLAVFSHHAQHIFNVGIPFFGEYGGQFGVQLFFLLSGYLVTGSYLRYSIGEYAVHRVFRIFPAYWFFFLLFGVVINKGVTFGSVMGNPGGFFANLFLYQHLVPSYQLSFDVLHVNWTLTIEILWYLSLPLLLLVFKRFSTKVTVCITVFSTVFLFVAEAGYLNFLAPVTIGSNPAMRYFFLDNHFFSQLCFFVFGGYIFFHEQVLRKIFPIFLFLAFVVIFLLKPFYLVVNPLFITGIGLGCLMVSAINSRLVNFPVGRFVSEISFSIYLCHFPIIELFFNYFGLRGYWGVCVSLLVTLVVSTVSYFLIEKPCMSFGKHFAKALSQLERPVFVLGK